MQRDYEGQHSLPEAEFNIADEHRRLMIRLLFILASAIVLFYSVINFIEGLRILPTIQLLCGLGGLISLRRLRLTRHLMVWTTAFLIILYSIVLLAVLSVEGSDTNFVWVYIIPVLSYSLLGLKPGLLISLPFMIISLASLLSHYLGLYDGLTPRTLGNLVNLVACGGLMMVFMHFYEKGRAETQRQLVHLAATDALTDLPNRGQFQSTLRTLIADSRRREAEFTLIVLDLDHFKQVNDSHGHDAGDAILRQLGRCMENSVRESDFIARLGGEEFAVILREASADTALGLAESLRERIARHPFSYEGLNIQVNATLGVAVFPHDGQDATALYKAADERLYRGKHQGRNLVVAD